MRTFLLQLFILSMPFLGEGSNLTEIHIKGQLIGFKNLGKSMPKKVRYTLPLNGSCYWGFSDTASISSDGSFDVVIESSHPVFIKMYVLGTKKGVVIFANPSDTLEIFLYKMHNFQEQFEITPNQEVHRLYNNLYSKLSPSIHQGLINFTKNQHTLEDKLRAIEKVQNSYKHQMDSLEKNNPIDPLLKNSCIEDFDSYFTTLKTKAILYDMVNQKSAPIYLSLAESLFDIEALNSKELIRSSWWFDLAQNYIKLNLLKRSDFNLDSAQLRHAEFIQEAQNILKNDALEYYIARYLHHTALQKKFDENLIPIYKEFNVLFPESNFLPYLSSLMQEIISFHGADNWELNRDILFIKNPSQIKSLSDLKLIFNDKVMYINLWTTWCLPCKKEFKFINELKQKADANNIRVVFISLDKPEKKEYWKKTVLHYKLSGLHIMANQSLYKSIIEFYNGPVTLPKYILVDKNGEILSFDFSPPSEIIKSGFNFQ